MGWARRVWDDKWLGLVVGMWIQACGGISYVFSLYSGSIKHKLHYNQEEIDGLGTAKDIGGNVGLLSGILYNFLPPWTIILIGAISNSFGYFMLWLSVTKKIRPTYWQMCTYICVGTNGSTWFNTAVLVTCMKNFPTDRGVVVGLLVGVVGLSGAVFTQFYLALYAPVEESFLFLAAILPTVVALSVMFFVRPVEVVKGRDDGDRRSFLLSYVIGFVLAAYLLVVIVVQDWFEVTAQTSWWFMIAMLALLLAPVAIPLVSVHTTLPIDQLLSPKPRPDSPSTQILKANSFAESPSSDLRINVLKQGDIPETPSKLKLPPRIGQDFTLLQACMTEEYWLLFIAMGCGTGSGLTAINNLAQMAEALGSDSVDAFVSLVSVWNFLGRMGAGYISEQYVKHRAIPRPFFLMLVIVAMGVAHLLFASSQIPMLYLGSVVVGVSHGAHWSIMVATASELFGLENFGGIYNTLSISSTIGSYLCSVKLAGYFYDKEIAKSQKTLTKLIARGFYGRTHVDEQTCIGPDCFRMTFLIMAGICGLGVLLCIRLIRLIRQVYVDMHKQHRQRTDMRAD